MSVVVPQAIVISLRNNNMLPKEHMFIFILKFIFMHSSNVCYFQVVLLRSCREQVKEPHSGIIVTKNVEASNKGVQRE